MPIIENNQEFILGQGLGTNSLVWELTKIFQENGTSVGWYEITKAGRGKRTKYSLIPVAIEDHPVYNGGIAKSKLIKTIAYNKQLEYYKR